MNFVAISAFTSLSFTGAGLACYFACLGLGFVSGPFVLATVRLILIVGNLVLLVQPCVTVAERSYALYDLAGALAIAGLAVTLVASTLRSTRRLYQLERLDAPANTRPSDAGSRPS